MKILLYGPSERAAAEWLIEELKRDELDKEDDFEGTLYVSEMLKLEGNFLNIRDIGDTLPVVIFKLEQTTYSMARHAKRHGPLARTGAQIAKRIRDAAGVYGLANQGI